MKPIAFFLIGILIACPAAAEERVLSLSLPKAMQMASKQNPQVMAANERVQQALANISVNRSFLMPQVSGAIGGKRQTTDLRAMGINIPGDPHVGPFNSFDARGRLTFEIFDASAFKRIQAARAGEKLSQAQLVKARQDMAALAGTLFLEAWRSDQAVSLTRVQLTQARRDEQLAKVRLKQGIGSALELDEALMKLREAKYAFKTAEVLAQETKLDLMAALGLSAEQKIVFATDERWINKQVYAAGVAPDVAVAQAQVQLAQENLRKARADFLPKLSAFGDYGRLGETPSASSSTYALGLSLTLPLWEGGLLQAELKRSQAQLKEQEFLLSDTRNHHQVRILKAKNDVEKARLYLAAKTAQFKYAQHQWNVMSRQLKSGLASRSQADQINSYKALSEDATHEARALFLTAKINLANIEGRLEDLYQ